MQIIPINLHFRYGKYDRFRLSLDKFLLRMALFIMLFSCHSCFYFLFLATCYFHAANATLFNFTVFQPKVESLSPTKEYQLNLLRNGIIKAKKNYSQLIVLPELFLSGYNLNLLKTQEFAETINGPSYNTVVSLANEFNISILFTFPEKECDTCTTIYDTAAFIYRNGSTLSTYRKINIVNGTEDVLFGLSPGTKISPVIECDGVLIGLAICFDIWYPEIFRVHALSSAQLILVPTAEGYPPGINSLIDRIIPARALENSAVVAYVNWVQNLPVSPREFKYLGQSVVYSYSEYGPLYQGSTDQQEMFTLSIQFDTPSNLAVGRRKPNFENNLLCQNIQEYVPVVDGYNGEVMIE